MLIETFVKTLKSDLLPDCFTLDVFTIRFPSDEAFLTAVEGDAVIADLAAEALDLPRGQPYTDVYASGFLGGYALALWFMEFDEDNWFSFNQIHHYTNLFLNSRPAVKSRAELRLLKGGLSSCKLDIPVVVDYLEKTVSILRCDLKG